MASDRCGLGVNNDLANCKTTVSDLGYCADTVQVEKSATVSRRELASQATVKDYFAFHYTSLNYSRVPSSLTHSVQSRSLLSM